MFENITEADKAYLAGIIDGEGCLYVDRQKTGRNPIEYRDWVWKRIKELNSGS